MVKTKIEVYDYNTATWKPRVGEDVYRKVPVEATLDFLPWAQASVHPSSGELGVVTIEPPIVRVENNPLFPYREPDSKASAELLRHILGIFRQKKIISRFIVIISVHQTFLNR